MQRVSFTAKTKNVDETFFFEQQTHILFLLYHFNITTTAIILTWVMINTAKQKSEDIVAVLHLFGLFLKVISSSTSTPLLAMKSAVVLEQIHTIFFLLICF